jgi:heme exporter protein A
MTTALLSRTTPGTEPANDHPPEARRGEDAAPHPTTTPVSHPAHSAHSAHPAHRAQHAQHAQHAHPLPLELAQVARRFGERWALRGVSLRVEPGEVLAIIGHNGSGKSTLLRVAATALRPTRGGGTVYGHDIVRDAGSVRTMVGMLAHAPGLYEDLTATENLRFTLEMLGRRADRATIVAALEAVGLAEEEHERVRGFSAGMHRRLSLARLLVQSPRLLLLDEPYSAFDAAGIGLVNGLVERTRAAGGAVLLVTHDIARARVVADRWVRMERGKLLPITGAAPLDDTEVASDEAASTAWSAERGA